MKKSIVIILLLFCALPAIAQENFYPYDSPELLVGKKVKTTVTYGLYKNKGTTRSIDDKQYVNQVYTVIGVQDTDLRSTKVLILENPSLGKVYYSYKVGNAKSYTLVAQEDLNLPADYFCTQFKKSKSDDGEEIWFSPRYSDEYYLAKYVKENRIYLALYTYSNTLDINKTTPSTIAFTDGSTLAVKFDSSYQSAAGKSGWNYSLSLTLTPEQITTFKAKAIKSYKFFGSDIKLSPGYAVQIQEYLKCFTK